MPEGYRLSSPTVVRTKGSRHLGDRSVTTVIILGQAGPTLAKFRPSKMGPWGGAPDEHSALWGEEKQAGDRSGWCHSRRLHRPRGAGESSNTHIATKCCPGPQDATGSARPERAVPASLDLGTKKSCGPRLSDGREVQRRTEASVVAPPPKRTACSQEGLGMRWECERGGGLHVLLRRCV